MRTSRWLVTCMMLLAAFALAVPAVTLAGGGGGSAGDQQYTDPFAGTAPGKSKPKTTATTPPPTSTQPATTAPPAPTPTTSATPVSGTTAASDPTTPTATIASTSTAGQLPHTGYDGWLAAALGFALVAGGLGLRARLRHT